MRRHIVRPLGAMGDVCHSGIRSMRHKATVKGLQIDLDIGISVLLYQQGGRGVPHQKRQEPVAAAVHPITDIAGEFVEARASSLDHKGRLGHFVDLVKASRQ